MIPVTNRTNWESYFKQLVIRNCDLKIYDNNYPTKNLLINKTNIQSFSLSHVNSFVCENLPVLDGEVVISDWDKLSYAVRKRFYPYNPDNPNSPQYFNISFVVENDESNTFQCLIRKIKVDKDEKTAKVYFGLNTLTMSKQSSSGRYYDDYPRGDIYSQCETNVWTRKSMSMTNKLSHSEYLRNIAISTMKGVTYNGVFKIYDINTIDGSYHSKNIYDDYEIDIDDSQKNNLIVYGIEQRTSQLIIHQNNIHTNRYDVFNVKFDKSYVVDGYTVSSSAYGTIYDYDVYISAVGLTFYPRPRKTNPPHSYDGNIVNLTVTGYEAVLINPDENIEVPYIQTYGVVNGSQECLNVQAYCRSYYSNKKIISFNCRIDPTIQPLDIIDIEFKDKTIRVVIEEVTINFNGGFTGSIKGRIAEGLRSISLTQVEDYYTVGDVFVKPTVTATYFDGTTRDVTNSATFSGFDNTSVGKQTVTVSYTENGKTATASYEITMHPAKPVISGQWFDIDTGTYGFDVKNNNNVACQLEIGYSDNDSNVWESVNITVPANSTYSANAGNIEDENDRNDIGMYFYDYFEQGGLADSLYCHFIATVDGVDYQSQDEYILEEY